jgi:alkylation response protein AidB-like acyl-CoA dehydrogenase
MRRQRVHVENEPASRIHRHRPWRPWNDQQAAARDDVAAARLLTYSAAQSFDRGDQSSDLITRALEFASNAALRAVDAAIRVEGVGGYTKNGLLERLSRDARTLQVIRR